MNNNNRDQQQQQRQQYREQNEIEEEEEDQDDFIMKSENEIIEGDSDIDDEDEDLIPSDLEQEQQNQPIIGPIRYIETVGRRRRRERDHDMNEEEDEEEEGDSNDEDDDEEFEEVDDEEVDDDDEMPVDYGDFDFNIDRVLGYINNQGVHGMRDVISQLIRAAGANGSLLFGNSTPSALKEKIDQLPIYGSDDFTFEQYSKIISESITNKEQLDKVALRFLQLDEPILSVVGKEKFKFPYCQHEWTEKTWFFRCKDCEITQTSCICLECFKKGNHIHEGHSFMPEQSNQGGCCDCGNSDSWKPEGFCSSHFLPEKPIHPSDLLDPNLKKKFHLFLRLVLHVLVDIIETDYTVNNSSPVTKERKMEADCSRISFIVTWLEDLASNSYPVSYILSEEFSQRLLDQSTFSLLDPTPLPYISPSSESHDSNTHNPSSSSSTSLYLPPKSIKSPMITVLSAIEHREDILHATKTLLVTLMGNKLFKVAFCNEYLSFYERFALSPSSDMRITISSISCQMFEIPSIVQSFSTGYSTHNLLLKIIDVFSQLIEHRKTYNFDLPTDREEYEQYLISQDFYYVSSYFKYEKISKFVYENEIVFHKIFSLCKGIQGMLPIKRQLLAPLPYELPIISNLVSLENQNINSFHNFLQSIHKLKYPSLKFLQLLIDNIYIGDEFKLIEIIAMNNGYQYPESDIFHGITSISLHQPFARLFGNYCLNASYYAPDYSLETIKKLIPKDKLLFIFNSLVNTNILLFQHNAGLWEKNINIGEFKSYYTWSFMSLDIFTLQFISTIVGPNYFLHLLINSFTSNFKLIVLNKSAISDLFKFIIQILQNRSTPNFSPPEARYHLVQGVISNYNSHSTLMGYRREFHSLDFVEDLIEEITEKGTDNKKLHLKEQMWDRFDYYYPYHFCERDAFADLSLGHYHEYLKKKNDPLQDTYPLPPILEPLHPNLKGVNDLFDEPFLYDIMFIYLLKFVRPASMLVDHQQVPSSTFLLQPCFISNPKQMENLTNHILYLLVLAVRTFTETTIPQMTQQDLESLKSKGHSLLLANDDNTTAASTSNIEPKMILLLLKRYRVMNGNGETTQVNILDIILDLLEIIQKSGSYIEKKSLISKLLTMLGDYDMVLLEHFHNKVNLEDFIKAQSEREYEAKKREALLRQKAIREKMIQQQIQFLNSIQQSGEDDDMADDLSSTAATSGVASTSEDLVCVACKESTRTLDNPLCAVGMVEGSAIKLACYRSSLMKLAKENGKSRYSQSIHNMYQSWGNSFVVESLDSVSSLSSIMQLIRSGTSMNVRCCNHYVHKSCMENYVDGRLIDGFHCPLCNRSCNILLAIDSIGFQAVTIPLALSLLESDTTYQHYPSVLNIQGYRYLWKFPLCNIENLEIISRPNNSFSDTPYFIYSESEFKNQLRTLRLLYYNIMSIPSPFTQDQLKAIDLMSDKYSAENDPFTLASFSHYFFRTANVHDFIEKAYERLIFLIFSTTAERYFTANLLNTIVYEDLLSQQFELLKNYLKNQESEDAATKTTTTTTTISGDNNNESPQFVLGFIKKVNKRIQPFLRKTYLLLHCIKSFAKESGDPPLNNDDNDLTLGLFQDNSYLLQSIGLRSPLKCILEPKYNELGQLYRLSKANTNFLSYIPLKIPTFIDLPPMYINFLMDYLMEPCDRGNCEKLPKGVCLVCAKVICLDNTCCPEELLRHTHNCGNGMIATLGIINPTVNVFSHSGSVASLHIYFDKYNEPSTKTKPNLKLNPLALKELYINWMKGFYQERSL